MDWNLHVNGVIYMEFPTIIILVISEQKYETI